MQIVLKQGILRDLKKKILKGSDQEDQIRGTNRAAQGWVLRTREMCSLNEKP